MNEQFLSSECDGKFWSTGLGSVCGREFVGGNLDFNVVGRCGKIAIEIYDEFYGN